jgi:hypothetical protein
MTRRSQQNPSGGAPGERRPLERPRDWVVTILGLIAVGIGVGYLFEGKLVAWPLIISLGVFIVALKQRYSR